jgi:hypothetical protein
LELVPARDPVNGNEVGIPALRVHLFNDLALKFYFWILGTDSGRVTGKLAVIRRERRDEDWPPENLLIKW